MNRKNVLVQSAAEARQDAIQAAEEFLNVVQAVFWILADEALQVLKTKVDEASLYSTGKRHKLEGRKIRAAG